MKVFVVGKRVVKGVKDGQAYSYCVAHCQYEIADVEGVAVEPVRLYSRIINPDDVLVKSFYNLDRDSTGRIIDFSYVAK